MTDLIERLKQDYPNIRFIPDSRARWSSSEQTIYYTLDQFQTLHELGHYLSGHSDFNQDIELLHIEREAWDRAAQIAPNYGLHISIDLIEDALDSYREWLHTRSLCPRCNQTGVQSSQDLSYTCPNCHCHWIANDGRSSGLRRYTQKEGR